MSEVNREALLQFWEWAEEQDQLRREGKPNEWLQFNWYVDVAALLAFYERAGFPDDTAELLRETLNTDCGTACCAAGYAVSKIKDMRPMVESHGAAHVVHAADRISGSETTTISNQAQVIYGLTDEQASRFFAASNMIMDMRAMLVDWGVLRVTGLLPPKEARLEHQCPSCNAEPTESCRNLVKGYAVTAHRKRRLEVAPA